MAKKQVVADAPIEVRDRIKGLIEVNAEDVHDHPHQWRMHPESQIAALRDVLGTIGQANVIVVYRSDGYFPGELVAIDGHGRKNDSGVKRWKAIELDVNDAEADVLLATMDPISSMAQKNSERFQALYDALPVQREATQLMLDDLYGVRIPERNLPFAVAVPDNSVEPNEGVKANPGQGLQMGVPASAVRMVQLYLSSESHPILMGWVDALSDQLDTANITETIMAAVKFAYEVVVESVAPSDLLSELREAHEEPADESARDGIPEGVPIRNSWGKDWEPGQAITLSPSDMAKAMKVENLETMTYDRIVPPMRDPIDIASRVAAKVMAEDEGAPAVQGLASIDGDTAYICEACNIAWDKEDAELGDGRCPVCGADLVERSLKGETA